MKAYETYSRQEWQRKKAGKDTPHSGLLIKDAENTIRHFMIPVPGTNPDEIKKARAATPADLQN